MTNRGEGFPTASTPGGDANARRGPQTPGGAATSGGDGKRRAGTRTPGGDANARRGRQTPGRAWFTPAAVAGYIEGAVQKLQRASPVGGAPVYHICETTSTMSAARELIAGGAPSGVVVMTDFQSEGRGRFAGRKWLSPPGESLMFTVAIRDADPHLAPLRAGLAVAQALESLSSASAATGSDDAPLQVALRPYLKWPNDILVADRKICGVLCEYAHPWLLIGVGLNLLQDDFPASIAFPATSLAMQGISVERTDLLMGILTRLAGTPDDVQAQVNRRLWRRGERVTVVASDGSPVAGVISEINKDGSLVIVRNGAEVVLVAGEIERPGEDGVVAGG